MMMRKMPEQTKGMIMKMKMPEQTTMDHRWAGCRTLVSKSCFSSRQSNTRAVAREKAKLDQLEIDAVTPLYEGCRPEDTRLKVTLMALEMKVKHKMNDRHERLPKGNKIGRAHV